MTDMHDEVVEAVCEYYKNDQDTAADCLVYLSSLKEDINNDSISKHEV